MRNLLSSLMLALVLSGVCFADSMAVKPTGLSTSKAAFTGLIGWEFTVNSPIAVTQLGIWDPKGTLAANHSIDIFSANGTLLDSVTIAAGSYTAKGGFVFVNVPQFILGPGTYEIGTSWDNSSDRWITSASGLKTMSQITLDQEGLSTTGSSLSSTSANVSGANYMSADFKAVPVPEPSVLSSIVCSAIGTCFAAFVLRRKQHGA